MDLSKIVKRNEPETRTTCKLTQKGCDDLDYLMESLGLTHKKILNCIMADEEFFEMLITVAKQGGIDTSDCNVRKTLVIQNDDLKVLNDSATKTGVNRNVLIDFGIRSFASLMRVHRDNTLEKYRIAFKSLSTMCANMEKLERELASLLEKDDHFFEQYGMVIVNQMNLVSDLEEEIHRLTAEKSKSEGK